MRGAPGVLLVAAGCGHALPEDQPCVEVGTAIGARTEDCTGDVALAVARIDAFEQGYACDLPPEVPDENQPDLYECALVLRNLACELVVEAGDDLDAWLAANGVCALILEPR